jgi:hypothetical protein
MVTTANGQSPLQEGSGNGNALPFIRNVWEVPAAKLRVNNASWGRFLGSVMNTVEEKLGVDTLKGMEMMAPSLILYRPGNRVKPCPA